MSKQQCIKASGEVTEALGDSRFRVLLETGVPIIATLSGKMRLNYVKVIPGDKVELEMSPYDLTKGRITYRKRS